MATTAFRVQVHGRVTGVGFRFSALREAARYDDLRGYVRNADSRTVECVVQGEAAAVNHMLAWLRHGPTMAVVTDVQIADAPVSPDLRPFHISY